MSENYIDVTEGVIISIKSLSGEYLFSDLVGRKIKLNHDDLGMAESRGLGVSCRLLESNIGLVINSIQSVDYGEDMNTKRCIVTISNEGYRYVILEDELM